MEADIITLHTPLTHAGEDATLHLFDTARLRAMKRGSMLINTCRGAVVENAALKAALQSGHLAGAALDVFSQEPYVGPLGKLPQVLCTSHVATLTRASRIAMELRCAQNIVSFFSQVGYDKRSGINA